MYICIYIYIYIYIKSTEIKMACRSSMYCMYSVQAVPGLSISGWPQCQELLISGTWHQYPPSHLHRAGNFHTLHTYWTLAILTCSTNRIIV